MDFDGNLAKLSGVLRSFNEKVTDQEKVECLKAVFENQNKNVKSKMVFFMILNTKLQVSESLKLDDNVCLLTDICPNINLAELITFIVKLELVDILSDVINNCPSSLSLELLGALYKEFIESRTRVQEMEKIFLAIYSKIEKIELGLEKDIYLTDFLSAWEMFIEVMVDKSKEEVKIEDTSLVFLHCILSACISCVQLSKCNKKKCFCDNLIFALDNNLYESVAHVPQFSKGEKLVSSILPHLKHCLTKVLDSFSHVFVIIKENECNATLVTQISESAYLLFEEVKDEVFAPENLHYLELIKKKPEFVECGIEMTDIDMIVYKVNAMSGGRNWFKALVNNPNNFNNENVITCVINHLKLADMKDVKCIMESINVEFKKSGSLCNELQKLYFMCLEKMTLEDQLVYFDKYFEGDLCFKNGTVCSDEELILKFNKLSNNTDASVKSSLVLTCICSPLQTLTKICQQGLLNTTLLNDCVNNLIMMKSACFWKGYEENEPALNLISYILLSFIKREALMDAEKRGLVKLITRLLKNKILNENFIEVCIVDIIRDEINRNLKKVIFLLEVLESSLKTKMSCGKKIVLLAFMSQVLDNMSWDSFSFSVELANAREITISIVKYLLKSLEHNDEAELIWLRHEIMKNAVINQIYFCDLWFAHDLDFVTSKDLDMLYVHLLLALHTKEKAGKLNDFIVSEFKFKELHIFRSAFTVALIKVLPILTVNEWISLTTLMKSIITELYTCQTEVSDPSVELEILRLFTTAMNCLAEHANEHENAKPCLEYCIRNLGKVLKNNMLSDKKNLKYDLLVEMMKSILCILNSTLDSIHRKSHSLILAPVIFEIANSVKSAETEEASCIREMDNWFRSSLLKGASDE